jgi:hypothetical protein
MVDYHIGGGHLGCLPGVFLELHDVFSFSLVLIFSASALHNEYYREIYLLHMRKNIFQSSAWDQIRDPSFPYRRYPCESVDPDRIRREGLGLILCVLCSQNPIKHATIRRERNHIILDRSDD